MINTKHLLIKSLLPAFFALILSTQSFSQKKTFEGYYIGKNGDTVKGIFPSYTQWSKSPAKVDFVPSAATTRIQLTTENCRKFYIENFDTYLSFTGHRMINPIEFDEAVNLKDSIGFADRLVPVTAFARLVGKTGNCEIYLLSDNIRNNFYYRLNDEPLQELKFKMYYDQGRVNEVNEYRQQLNGILKNEIEKWKIPADLAKLEYNEESISGLIEKLTPVQKRKAKVKSPLDGFLAGAGVSVNLFRVSGDKTIAEVMTKYKISLSPLLSIGYFSSISRNFNRFFVYPHVNLFNYKNSGDVTVDVFKKISTFRTSLVVAPIVNVGANIVNTDKLKYFLSFGAGAMFLFGNKQQAQIVAASNDRAYASGETKLAGLPYNVNISTGIILKNRVHATASYNVPAPVANFDLFSPYHTSIQVSLSYKL